MNWCGVLRGRIRKKEPLKKHTTFKVGGPAEFFFEPEDIRDLKSFISLVKRHGIGFRIIGAGSNILISDKGIKGAVLRLSSQAFKKISFNKTLVRVGAGKPLWELILECRKKGLSGLEFLVGIPGTAGGALLMNAGVKEKNIGDLVRNVTVIDRNGQVKILSLKKLKFGYRKSNLEKFIVLAASLKLVKKDRQAINENIKNMLDYRRRTQDYSYPSAGCVFKNPKGNSAGRLIDLCGLKDKSINGAGVSKIHANFILNLNQAKSSDILRLIQLITNKVRSKFKITLEPEIKIWQ